MYKIENGTLMHNGKKVYALGQSYYPSFHHAKYPVPPEGDRIGEMKKDLKMMKEMGFNHVRFAAIGITKLDENGKLIIDTPFVDAMIEEADKNDLSVSIRLQGYAVNLRDFKNVLMINNEGKEQDTSIWYDFIQVTLHHAGLLEDNVRATKGLAEHYDEFDNVVAYQIYNEPHYPNGGVFDYHPNTIKAYRKWLVNKNYMTAEETEDYEPPRSRKEQSARMWALWRLFSRDSLTNFLNSSSDAVKEVSSRPTFTCFTPSQLCADNSEKGLDYFENSKAMDIFGYTCYCHPEGTNYFTLGTMLDMSYSAAAINGKKAWCIELDSRTKIPPRVFNKNTYATVGAGIAGIMYYQWRGDYPSEATPIPNGCGLVNYDGSKTANFENAAKMVKLINELSDYLVDAVKVHSGVGILFSDYASFYCDAAENDDNKPGTRLTNTFTAELTYIYTELRRLGYSVDIVNAEALNENKLRIKTLFVPARARISCEEESMIEAFIQKGGSVYELDEPQPRGNGIGFQKYKEQRELYESAMSIYDISDLIESNPPVVSDSHYIMPQLLEGENYKIIALTNISYPHKDAEAKLTCDFKMTRATLYTSLTEPKRLKVINNIIETGIISDGGFIIAE